ncbi:L-2-hydroxyglutarate dehydrogenase, mitochondrial [Papilio machaon]|uniref:L-2-hydroxyglutarate dehydrogenase, mitochondrial n=1 Tax=Papilio machaon TaxID=76193 RepID=A0A194R5M1_PAPMA|nr:L-2-hydroxyglutarate dehydrogenase, mitochondrial [Papilio machaon]KPJ11161.1 L-2-hydroxyglutarate dehydrogenase, mitochondrial [Papilio machaon]
MSFITKSAVSLTVLSSKIFQCSGFLNYTVTRRYSNQKEDSYDVVVIGGGIVGSASARELILRHPTLKIAIVEKENRFACHQSGNNSGVIHAGIYYKPGSLKAKLCVEGLNLSYQYLDKKGIKYSKCGKLIVATQRSEVPRLLDLYDRGVKNGVKDIKLMDSKEMHELEPNCKGLEALWSPHTGIVDWGEVTNSYVKDFEECGGKSYLNFEVTKFIESEGAEYPVTLNSSKGNKIEAKYVLTCCGLQSDTVAVLTGCPEEPKIIPFRGEYLYLKPNKSKIANANIYPVPDPRFPFLGVHLTPKIDGRVIVGPNAILAFCKEGYRWGDVNMKELREIIKFSGFQRMALKYASFGLKEMSRSLIMPLQVMQIQKYIQNITSADVERGPAGVRAQAMAKDGTLIEDFVFDSQPGSGAIGSRVLHCRNAPSPGATSSLAIAKMIADKMEEEFKL